MYLIRLNGCYGCYGYTAVDNIARGKFGPSTPESRLSLAEQEEYVDVLFPKHSSTSTDRLFTPVELEDATSKLKAGKSQSKIG